MLNVTKRGYWSMMSYSFISVLGIFQESYIPNNWFLSFKLKFPYSRGKLFSVRIQKLSKSGLLIFL